MRLFDGYYAAPKIVQVLQALIRVWFCKDFRFLLHFLSFLILYFHMFWTFIVNAGTIFLMRWSNCSAPIPPCGVAPGLEEKWVWWRRAGHSKMKWKRAGHSKMKGLKWLIRMGQDRNKVIKRPLQPPKKLCPRGCPRGDGGRTMWPVHK